MQALALSSLVVLSLCVGYAQSANTVGQGNGFPRFIPTSGTFDVPVAFSSDGTNTVVIDVLKSTSPYTWYGKGMKSVTTGSSGTATITVTLNSSPPTGAGTMLKVWMVNSAIYNANPGSASSSQLVFAEYPLPVGSSDGGGDSGGNDPSPPTPLGTYDFVELLDKTLWFYEAQRSGALPPQNRVAWRQSSALGDKGANNEDLTGGWYDAGDGVKFNFPMAYSTTVLAWSVVDHRAAYESTGQLVYALANLKWACDYFIKCHVSANELYGQVGNGGADHSFWGRPEDMTMSRPAYKIDATHPGSDLAAETAAAMAATSIAFRSTDSVYADKLISHATTLFNFADTYKGKYSSSITDAANFYNSGDYWDELTWAAAWLYRATGTASYLTTAQSYYVAHSIGYQTWAFSWDQKSPGVMALMYKITGTQGYQNDFDGFMRSWMPGGGMTYTPKGIAWRDQWGSLRYSANTAFLALMDADYVNATNPTRARTYFNWALGQIKLMIGDAGRSYVVGYGNNPPTHVHHRAASCPPVGCSSADLSKSSPNPNILYGALVGGPGQDDSYVDVRTDYQKNEVACDYNAGFTGAVARLVLASSDIPSGNQGASSTASRRASSSSIAGRASSSSIVGRASSSSIAGRASSSSTAFDRVSSSTASGGAADASTAPRRASSSSIAGRASSSVLRRLSSSSTALDRESSSTASDGATDASSTAVEEISVGESATSGTNIPLMAGAAAGCVAVLLVALAVYACVRRRARALQAEGMIKAMLTDAKTTEGYTVSVGSASVGSASLSSSSKRSSSTFSGAPGGKRDSDSISDLEMPTTPPATALLAAPCRVTPPGPPVPRRPVSPARAVPTRSPVPTRPVPPPPPARLR